MAANEDRNNVRLLPWGMPASERLNALKVAAGKAAARANSPEGRETAKKAFLLAKKVAKNKTVQVATLAALLRVSPRAAKLLEVQMTPAARRSAKQLSSRKRS